MALAWYIDGKNLKEYGITVSGSIGLVDGLQMKPPFKVDLPDYHGEIVDLEKPRYEPRDITLNCWIKAFGMLDFAIKVNTFIQSIKGDGTHRFMIEIDPNRPLVYEVYFPDKTAIDKIWNDSSMIGTFSIKMRESEPIKKILSFITPRYGGRNLINDSKIVQVSKVSGQGANRTITVDLIQGETYTLSYKDTDLVVANAYPQFFVWELGNWSKLQYLGEVSAKTRSFKFTLPTGKYTFSVYNHNYPQSGTINELKLEKGSKATDWTPNPEDVPDGAMINISTDKLVNIHWGDGSHDYDVFGKNIVLKHKYNQEGIYFIVISGVIEEIKSLSTNATVIWNVI